MLLGSSSIECSLLFETADMITYIIQYDMLLNQKLKKKIKKELDYEEYIEKLFLHELICALPT